MELGKPKVLGSCNLRCKYCKQYLIDGLCPDKCSSMIPVLIEVDIPSEHFDVLNAEYHDICGVHQRLMIDADDEWAPDKYDQCACCGSYPVCLDCNLQAYRISDRREYPSISVHRHNLESRMHYEQGSPDGYDVVCRNNSRHEIALLCECKRIEMCQPTTLFVVTEFVDNITNNTLTITSMPISDAQRLQIREARIRIIDAMLPAMAIVTLEIPPPFNFVGDVLNDIIQSRDLRLILAFQAAVLQELNLSLFKSPEAV